MGLWQDVQFAVRLLIKEKWFTLVAALALALGIGVNAAVFTFVNAIIIRGLPYHESNRLIAINSNDVNRRERVFGVSYRDFKDWSAGTQSFIALAAHTGTQANVSDEGKAPERFIGGLVSANAFRLVGVQPILGRDFLPDDDRPGAPAVVLLGSSIWKNRYGGDPNVIGKTIRVNDNPSVVIGVMPEGFKGFGNSDLWLSISSITDLEQQPRNSRGFEVLGRLKPGVTLEQAQAEMNTINEPLRQQFPDTNKDLQPLLQGLTERMTGGPLRVVFFSLMGAVAFVLLIACANCANLLLARSANRAREIAVRVSLGASRWRIIRQLLIESVLLAIISGVVGLALSTVIIRLFDNATREANRPSWIVFNMDLTVFAYLAAICLGTGILFGLAPAIHVAKTDVNEILKEGGRSGSSGVRARRLSGVLIVGELALTLTLLAGAGFMMRNFLTAYRMNLGVDTSNVLTMMLALPDRKYPALEQRLAFYQQLQDRLSRNSQFSSVTVASNAPLGGGMGRRLTVEGRTVAAGEQTPTVTMLTIDPRYLETMKLPVLRGRGFTEADGAPGQENALINAKFAQMHFPNEDPIGRRIVLAMDLGGGPAPTGGIPQSLTATIVGIVPNVRQRNFAEVEIDPVAYLPYRMDPRNFMMLMARTQGDASQLTSELREEVRAVDADLPLFNIRTLDENLALQRWPYRIFGSLFAFFAFIALLLSAIGLYAVTAYSVSQRTQEIGVRTALGAEAKQVTWLFMRRGLIQLAIGLPIGLAGAFGVGKIFAGSPPLLLQTTAGDPTIMIGIAALLALVALAACVWPARRAGRLDPLIALRRE